MWILESDADFLQGKRMWLKPGQKYLFGRVKRDGVQFAIDHKSISRKHFVITVEAVKPGDVARIHARSRVTITDLKSKQGTFVDGEPLSDDTRELKKAEHSIRPGNLQQDLIIKWHPCILTFNYTIKEGKAGVLKPKQDRIQDLDIKVINEYVIGETTHLVASKRNTPKGLQALVQGRHIVAESYVDALIYAATPADLGGEENLSPLEQDFEVAWPKEEAHLPPPGKEPTLQPAEAYRPLPVRSNVFEDFIFVFGDSKQYETLMSAISVAQGKALLYKVIDGETTVDDLVEYMRNTAGQKGFGDADKETDRGGVVLVRWSGKEPYAEWASNLINATASRLDQRAIDQSEFLGAILANDAFLLRATIPLESNNDGRIAPPASLTSQPPEPPKKAPPSKPALAPSVVPSKRPAPLSEAPPAEDTSVQQVDQQDNSNGVTNKGQSYAPPPPKRSRLRGAPIARISAFDDDFDIDAVASFEPPSQSTSMPPSQAGDDSREGSAASRVKDEPTSTHKRPRSLSSDPQQVPDDAFDDLLPAATAFKRRKLAQEAEARARGEPVESSPDRPVPAKPKSLRAKEEPEIDVQEALRQQREKEAEAATRQEQEHVGPWVFDKEKDSNPIIVETFEVKSRKQKVADQNQPTNGPGGPVVKIGGYRTNEWDDRWNGRKNYKSFVKAWPKNSPFYDTSAAGAAAQPQRRRKVIVPLVEWKPRSYGLGDQYWADTDRNNARDNDMDSSDDADRRKKQKRKAKQKASQPSKPPQRQGQTRPHTNTDTQTVNWSDNDEDEEDQATPKASEETPTSPALSRLQAEAASIIDDTSLSVSADTPRRTRQDDKTQTHTQAGTQSNAKPARFQPQTQSKTQARSTGPASSSSGARTKPSSSSSSATRRSKQSKLPVVDLVSSDREEGDSDDDDEEELKFRFGKRTREFSRRGKGAELQGS